MSTGHTWDCGCCSTDAGVTAVMRTNNRLRLRFNSPVQRSTGSIAPAADAAELARDVRASPVLRGPVGNALMRRALSVTILLLIDLTAVFLGIYAALAVKLAVQGQAVDPSVIWASERRRCRWRRSPWCWSSPRTACMRHGISAVDRRAC